MFNWGGCSCGGGSCDCVTAGGVVVGMVGSKIDCLWIWGSLGGCVSLVCLRWDRSSLCGRGCWVIGPGGVVAG